MLIVDSCRNPFRLKTQKTKSISWHLCCGCTCTRFIVKVKATFCVNECRFGLVLLTRNICFPNREDHGEFALLLELSLYGGKQFATSKLVTNTFHIILWFSFFLSLLFLLWILNIITVIGLWGRRKCCGVLVQCVMLYCHLLPILSDDLCNGDILMMILPSLVILVGGLWRRCIHRQTPRHQV